MTRRKRITANAGPSALTIYAAEVTASTVTRTLIGDIIRYGVIGRTSAGALKVRPGALTFPDDLTRVKLTKEHNRDESRGHLSELQLLTDRIRAAVKVSDGPEGDDALREATDKTRDGFSFDIVDAVVEGDEIVAGQVIAIGQVGIPAYDDTRIDTVAASQVSAPPTSGENMTPEQRARLDALRAQASRTAAEEAELVSLAAMESAPAAAAPAAETEATSPAAVSAPAAAPAAAELVTAAAAPAAAPAGVPITAGHSGAQVTESPLTRFVEALSASLRGDRSASITAALSDVTHAQHTANVSEDSWSGELWSGLEREPEFLDLFVEGELTSFDGRGWRWVTKPQTGDYAGNKADIPSNVVVTEPATWDAFRIAGGWDIDRKFFDFPDSAFIRSFFEAVREDIQYRRDMKVKNYILAQAVAPVGLDPQTTLLKAARMALKHVKRNTKAKGTFVLVNDDDYDDLFDIVNDEVPAFMDLLGVKPEDFRPSEDVTQGLVIAGVKQAAKVRWLGGASPIRVEAQNLTKAGIDDAFFTYGSIEEHHTTGIVKVEYDPEFVPA